MFEVLLVLPALLRQDVYIVLSITLYYAKVDYFRNQTFLFCPIIFNTTKVMPSVVSQGVAWCTILFNEIFTARFALVVVELSCSLSPKYSIKPRMDRPLTQSAVSLRLELRVRFFLFFSFFFCKKPSMFNHIWMKIARHRATNEVA